MCFITVHDKLQPIYFYGAISVGGLTIYKNATTAALESLGTTISFIYCWLKIFHNNYEVRSEIYHKSMKNCSNKYQLINPNHLVTI